MCVLGHVGLFATPQTVACQAPLVHGIFQARILEWGAISYSKGYSQPGIEPTSLAPPALVGRFFTSSAIWEAKKSDERKHRNFAGREKGTDWW